MHRARSAQRIDIANQIVDLGPCQCEVRHRTVRVRQERTKLVGGHTAVRDRLEARRPFLNSARGIAVDYVAAGAPLLGELAPSRGVGMTRMIGSDVKQKGH